MQPPLQTRSAPSIAWALCSIAWRSAARAMESSHFPRAALRGVGAVMRALPH